MPRRSGDFPQPVVDLLARRVGVRCSNPNCRQLTSGPHSDPSKHVNVGVAAHITAASPGGPRYDAFLSPDERRAPDNGIWLCQTCGALVDRDDPRYTADLLRQWKRLAEEAAQLDVEGGRPGDRGGASSAADRTRIAFFRQAFDRPAFQDAFASEGAIEDLDHALADTVTVLNTGALRSRDGVVLRTGEGKSFVEQTDWRAALDTIAGLVRALRERLAVAQRAHDLQLGRPHGGRQFYAFHDRELARWVDATRGQILHLFNDVCRAAGVPELRIPMPFGR